MCSLLLTSKANKKNYESHFSLFVPVTPLSRTSNCYGWREYFEETLNCSVVSTMNIVQYLSAWNIPPPPHHWTRSDWFSRSWLCLLPKETSIVQQSCCWIGSGSHIKHWYAPISHYWLMTIWFSQPTYSKVYVASRNRWHSISLWTLVTHKILKNGPFQLTAWTFFSLYQIKCYLVCQ